MEELSERRFPGIWTDKIFNLHLGTFAVAKNKVAGRDFVAEGLSLLGKTKGEVRIDSIDDVFIVGENALGGFWAKIGHGFFEQGF